MSIHLYTKTSTGLTPLPHIPRHHTTLLSLFFFKVVMSMLSGRLGGCSRRSLFSVSAGNVSRRGRISLGGVRTVPVGFVSRVSISSVSTAGGFLSPTTRTRTLRHNNSNSSHYGVTRLNHFPQQHSVRLFHATQPREILPIVGVAVLFILGRYSYKALRRMDDEWEEYQWELQRRG